MFDALSARSGERVAASDADAEDRFACPHCFFPVRLKVSKAGAFRPHFAHADAVHCKVSAEPSEWYRAAVDLVRAELGAAGWKFQTLIGGGPCGWDGLFAINGDRLPLRLFFFPDFARAKDIGLADSDDTYVIEGTPDDGKVTVPKNVPGLLNGMTVFVTDGTTLHIGRAEAIRASRLPVGRPHPILGQAYIDNHDRVHPTQFQLTDEINPIDIGAAAPVDNRDVSDEQEHEALIDEVMEAAE